jgi:hypothetical protein
MMTIRIEHTPNAKILCETPYSPTFPAAAKKLGGRWVPERKAWQFDGRDEAAVRALCVRLFGTDGSPETTADVLTIRAPSGVCTNDGTALWLAGRQVARVLGRDSGARLGDGVVVVTGSFGSGGSMKNPRIVVKAGTVFELRDVPRAMAEKVHAEYHGVTLLDAQGTVVLEPTSAEEPAPVVAEPSEIEVVEREIAAAFARLAGLRFRAAELRSA